MSKASILSPKFENLPQELISKNRWVTWRYVQKKPGEKPTKVPYQPHGDKHAASSTNPETWGTFEQAQAACISGHPEFDS